MNEENNKKSNNFNSKKKKVKDSIDRSRYLNYSSDFINWFYKIKLGNTSIFEVFWRLNKKYNLSYLSLTLIFSVILSILLYFNIDSSPTFRIGTIANFDVKSPIGFEIVDKIATEKKRKEAEDSVPAVFDYNPRIYDSIIKKVYLSFRKMRNEIRKIKWPKNEYKREVKVKDFFQYKEEFEDLLDYNVPDLIFEWLVNNKFNPRIENILIRSLEKWSNYKIYEASGKYIPKGHEKVILRFISPKSDQNQFYASEDYTIDKDILVDLNAASNFTLEKKFSENFLSERDFNNLKKIAYLMLVPNVTPNVQEYTIRKKRASESVLPVTLSAKKNQIIIHSGSVVQPEHLSLLREIKNIQNKQHIKLNTFSTAILFFSLILLFFSYFYHYSPNKYNFQTKDIIAMGTVILITLFMIKFFLFVTEEAFVSRFNKDTPTQAFLYLAPVASGPMLLGLLISYSEVLWIFILFITIVIGILVDMNFAYCLVALAGGVTAAKGVHSCKKRNDIYRAGLKVSIINVIFIILVLTITNDNKETLINELKYAVPAGFLSGIFSSMVAMLIVPILESVFNYTTNVRLLELSNLNHPLLKDMLVKAPGTYHHSMVVGNMVEAASEEIGANPLLAKVMAYYHDIGKIDHPSYYIENQRPNHNPHDQLSPYMSKTILVSHVKDGAEKGMKFKLGKPIIDGILQHHGTAIISFFHNKAVESKNQKKENQVVEEEFRYPGPRPQFKESGLLMLADGIEAATRSLDEPTTIRVQNIVKNIIQRRFLEGQLDNCNLTLKNLLTIEKSFIKILLGVYHQRLDYPKNAGGGTAETPKNLTP